MSNADRIIELLHEAKARPAGAERDRFLAEACGDDTALEEQIVSLLRADANEGESDFLKNTVFLRPIAPVTEKPGDRIGRYKLLEQIGEGGCGVVYMAEQEEPVRRCVALKVIKLGMDTKQVIARFEAERQALALMDHPNIAKVLDGGATDTGRPFFVMELVRGIKITDYCDQNNLSTNERLMLYIRVCQAIQHAHQKGIIHRDIKPSNILVTQHDEVAVPKVIDFGIAKATVGQLTDKTVFTAFAQFVGTPAYMSPEQAQMSGLDIDTRADIYSLGVLLYELLTGHTPFDAKELLAAGMDEMRRKIREDEPAKPSTCLSTMQAMDLTTVAKHRDAEPPKLIHLIRGDLDWLVMKCLEKDRTRRYETANGLAADIQRHLRNEPVTACPPSAWYEFQKTVRRHKFGFAAASAVIAALVLGLGLSTWMFLEEKQARQRAVAAEQEQLRLRRQAEAEASESRRIAAVIGDLAQTLGQDLGAEGNAARIESTYRVSLAMQMRLLGKEHQEIDDALSSLAQVFQQGKLADADTTAREAAQKCHVAMAHFEKLASDPGRHYESWFIAVAYKSLGMLFQRSGQSQEAEQAYRDSLVLWQKLAAVSDQEDDRWQLAHNYRMLGDLLRQTGRAAESLEAYRTAEAILLKLVADFSTESRRIHLGWIDDILGQMLNDAGRFDEAAHAYQQALVVWQSLVAEFNRAEHRNNRFRTLLSLAKTLKADGKRTEAELLFREAESDIREELQIQRKELGRGHAEAIRSVSLLSELLGRQGRLTEQEFLLQEQLGIETYPTESAQKNLGHLLWQQGNLHLQRNEFTNAARVYDQAVQTFKQLQTRFPEIRFYRKEEACSLRLFADAMQRANRLTEAEAAMRTSWGIYSQLAKEMPALVSYSQEAAFTYRMLAGVLIAQGRLDEAEVMCRDELASKRKQFGAIHREVDEALVSLAQLLQQKGKLAEAETTYREALAMRRLLLAADEPQLAVVLAELTRTLLTQQKFIEAEPLARECLTLREKKIPDVWLTFNARSLLGGSLLGQRKFAEAEPLLLSGYEGMKQRETSIPVIGKPRVKETLQRLVQLYEATGQPEKAAAWNERLAELEQVETEKKTTAP
jgi:tetratricopeptide (TPR) repeat protein